MIFSTEICLEAHQEEITREFLITILRILINKCFLKPIIFFSTTILSCHVIFKYDVVMLTFAGHYVVFSVELSRA